MENWDRSVARFRTAATVPVTWGWTEWLERAHIAESGQCLKPSGLLKGQFLKSPVIGFALCLVT